MFWQTILFCRLTSNDVVAELNAVQYREQTTQRLQREYETILC